MALLTQLPQREADAIVDAYFSDMASARQVNAAGRRKMVQRSRRLGYGFNEGDIVQGLVSVAVPSWNAGGEPFASLSGVGVDAHFSEEAL